MAELKLFFAYGAAFAWLWLFGWGMARRLQPRLGLSAAFTSPLALVCLAGAGYVTFWLTWLHPYLGAAATLFTGLMAVLTLVQLVTQGRAEVAKAFPWEVRVAAGLGLFYLGCLCLHGGGDNPTTLVRVAYSYTLHPVDHTIPLWFADALRTGEGLKTGMDAFGYTFSDRPPLQAGVVVLLRPLQWVFGAAPGYQGVGVALQVQWVVALVAVGRVVGLRRVRTGVVVLVTGISGHVFFNSVYVWPKLLAGALFLLAVALFLQARRESRQLTSGEAAFAAVTTALALLSHGGVVFSVLGMALIVPVFRRQLTVRAVVIAVVAIGLLYGPWIAYQKLYDPPGNRLVKEHLAGRPDAKGQRPASEVLLEAYRGQTVGQWAQARLDNVARFFGHSDLDRIKLEILRDLGDPAAPQPRVPGQLIYRVSVQRTRADGASLADIVRVEQSIIVFRALGVLNLVWLLGLLRLIRRRRSATSGERVLALLAVTTAGVSALLLFRAGFTFAHLLSYAFTLTLFFLAGAELTRAPRWLRRTVVALHLVWFAVVWVASVPNAYAFRVHQLTLDADARPVSVLAVLTGASVVGMYCLPSLLRYGRARLRMRR